MTKLYEYVGPASLAHLADSKTPRERIDSPNDVEHWISENGDFATFIVNESLELWLSDRRCEHVACARGGPVASAGEIMFSLDHEIQVEYVTNQSTGYCPEPASWPAVEASIRRAKLVAPPGFTAAFDFRGCIACSSINLVKNGVFECSLCGTALPLEWNLNEWIR